MSMEKFATENLILIEFLVDRVNFEFNVMKDLAAIEGETCVSFQFLDNNPILVGEADFSPNCPGAQIGSVKNGKSCLFSLTPDQGENALKYFDVYVQVFKKLNSGTVDRMFIGESLVSVSNLFSELMDAVFSGQLNCAKTLKDCFVLNASNGDVVGNISVYIRLSCYGKLIVTQFQMNMNNKSAEFKAKEGHYLFKSKKDQCRSRNVSEKPPLCKEPANLPPDCPTTSRCFPSLCNPRPTSTCSQPLPPCGAQLICTAVPCPQPVPNTCYPQTPCPAPPSCAKSHRPPTPAASSCPEKPYPSRPGFCTAKNSFNAGESPEGIGSYQQIETQMGMSGGMTVRLHDEPNENSKGRVSCFSTRNCPPSVCPKCSNTLPPCCYPPYCCPVPTCYQPICCTPPACCSRPSTPFQSLVMRPGCPDWNTSPFNFHVGGSGQGGNNICVSPPTTTSPDGTKFTEISDPGKEMFVLRIGKKTEGASLKNNVDLELCTPKPIPTPIPPVLDSKRVQYDAADVSSGKDRNDGKHKKDGKGKKGKGEGDAKKKSRGKSG